MKSRGSSKNEAAGPLESVMLHCEAHGDYAGQQRFIAMLGRYVESACPPCEAKRKQEEARYAAAKQAEEKRRRLLRLFGHSGIPLRFQSRTFANYQALSPAQTDVLAIAQHYAEQFNHRLQQGGGLVLIGKPGTGKTHLATAIANYLMEHDHPVLFLSVLRAIRMVKECYRRDAIKTEQQVIDEFVKPDLLILDEVGVQFGSETEKLILFEILNSRYEAVRPTILISNLTEAELVTYVGSRVMDRLREGCGVSLSFEWKSYRKQAHLNPALPESSLATGAEENRKSTEVGSE